MIVDEGQVGPIACLSTLESRRQRSPDAGISADSPQLITRSFTLTLLLLEMPLGLLALALVAAAPAAAQIVVEIHGLCFRSPLPLSPPQKIGLDALLVAYPPDAKSGEERFSLTAVRFPPEVTDTKAGMTPAELREYVAVVFLGGRLDDGPPLRCRLLEQWVEGEAFSSSIPVPSHGEVFALRRQDGGSVVMGFRVRDDWRDHGANLIDAISASLKEGEGSCQQAGLQGPGHRTRPMAPSVPTISTASR